MDNQWVVALERFGPVASGITVVHAVMSIAVLSIGLYKWWELRRRAAATRAFAPAFTEALGRRDVAGALRVAAEHPRSQVAQVLGAALRAARPFLHAPGRAEYAAGVADVAAEREQTLLSSSLRTGLGALATIGATATLLGLLGTVVGIMNAFTAMARAGGGSIEAIATGIGEALLTTAIGLIVAVPAVWAYTWLNGRLDRLFSELDYALQELVEWILVHDQPEVLSAVADGVTASAPAPSRGAGTATVPTAADAAVGAA